MVSESDYPLTVAEVLEWPDVRPPDPDQLTRPADRVTVREVWDHLRSLPEWQDAPPDRVALVACRLVRARCDFEAGDLHDGYPAEAPARTSAVALPPPTRDVELPLARSGRRATSFALAFGLGVAFLTAGPLVDRLVRAVLGGGVR